MHAIGRMFHTLFVTFEVHVIVDIEILLRFIKNSLEIKFRVQDPNWVKDFVKQDHIGS
jgi:hypothetical protein